MFKNKNELFNFFHNLKEEPNFKKINFTKTDLENLRDDIYNLILKAGDLAPRECLLLFEFYAKAKLSPKKELDIYIQTANKYLASMQSADEKLLFAELKAVCLMLNSDEKALLEYAKIISTLQFSQLSKVEEFIDFFNGLFKDIGFREFYKICKHLFNPKTFLSLSATEQKTILTNTMAYYLSFDKIKIKADFARIYELMIVLFNAFVKDKNLDMALYICAFMLEYFTDDKERVNAEVMQAIQNLAYNYAKNENLPKPHSNKHEKIRVGFMRGRVSFDLAYKIEYSMFKALLEDKKINEKCEFYFYSFQMPQLGDDNPVLMVDLISLGIDFKAPAAGMHALNKFLFDSLEKAKIIRDEIIADEIDVLIDLSGFNEIANFIFSTRTAKKQVYFAHKNAQYDIKNIDERASFCDDLSNDKFHFEKLSVPMDIAKFYNPPVDENLIQSIKQMYPKDAFIFGGDLASSDDERYLRCVAQILKDNKNSIFISYGTNSKSVQNKLKKFGMSKRVYFPGDVDTHLYGHIIDLWLGDFRLNFKNEKLNEYMSKSKPVLYYFEPKILKSQDENIKAFMQKLQELDFLALSEQDYIQKANELAKSPKMLATLGKNCANFITQTNKSAQESLIKTFNKIIDKF